MCPVMAAHRHWTLPEPGQSHGGSGGLLVVPLTEGRLLGKSSEPTFWCPSSPIATIRNSVQQPPELLLCPAAGPRSRREWGMGTWRPQSNPPGATTILRTVTSGLNPLCDIPSRCCSFTGPWTVTHSSLRMLRRVTAFCRPLRPVLLLVSFPHSRSPVVGVPGLCWMWHGVPFACQRRPIIGVLRMCWLLPGSFDCFCCPRASVHRPSIACLAVFLCGPGALFLHALSGPSTICPVPLHSWSAPDGLLLLLRKQPIWAAGDTPHLMPVEQGLPWHPVATGLAGPAMGYRCVCTTGAVQHKAEVQSKMQREKLFSDMSWAPFAAANERHKVHNSPRHLKSYGPSIWQTGGSTQCRHESRQSLTHLIRSPPPPPQKKTGKPFGQFATHFLATARAFCTVIGGHK